jgi:hypothetical protein
VPSDEMKTLQPRDSLSQTLFGNAPVFETLFRGGATELPGHCHSQTEFGNEEEFR